MTVAGYGLVYLADRVQVWKKTTSRQDKSCDVDTGRVWNLGRSRYGLRAFREAGPWLLYRDADGNGYTFGVQDVRTGRRRVLRHSISLRGNVFNEVLTAKGTVVYETVTVGDHGVFANTPSGRTIRLDADRPAANDTLAVLDRPEERTAIAYWKLADGSAVSVNVP